MSSQSIIYTYADVFGIHRQEVMDWVKGYIKRPGEFPGLIKAGLMEDTEEGRKNSIQKYLKDQVESSVTGKIRKEIFEEKAAIAEFDGGLSRDEAEKLAAKGMRTI